MRRHISWRKQDKALEEKTTAGEGGERRSSPQIEFFATPVEMVLLVKEIIMKKLELPMTMPVPCGLGVEETLMWMLRMMR